MYLDLQIEGHITFIRNLMLGLILFIVLVNLIMSRMSLNKYKKKDKEGLIISRVSRGVLIANTLGAVLFGALTVLVVLSNDILDGLTMLVYLVSYTVYILYVVQLYHSYTHFKFTANLSKNYIEVLNSRDNYKIYMESVKRIDRVSGYYVIYFNDEDKVTVRRNLEGLDNIMNSRIRNKYNINFNF